MQNSVKTELLDKIKGNIHVYNLFMKTIATSHSAYKSGAIDEIEYNQEYNNTLYRLSLLA